MSCGPRPPIDTWAAGTLDDWTACMNRVNWWSQPKNIALVAAIAVAVLTTLAMLALLVERGRRERALEHPPYNQKRIDEESA